VGEGRGILPDEGRPPSYSGGLPIIVISSSGGAVLFLKFTFTAEALRWQMRYKMYGLPFTEAMNHTFQFKNLSPSLRSDGHEGRQQGPLRMDGPQVNSPKLIREKSSREKY